MDAPGSMQFSFSYQFERSLIVGIIAAHCVRNSSTSESSGPSFNTTSQNFSRAAAVRMVSYGYQIALWL